MNVIGLSAALLWYEILFWKPPACLMTIPKPEVSKNTWYPFSYCLDLIYLCAIFLFQKVLIVLVCNVYILYSFSNIDVLYIYIYLKFSIIAFVHNIDQSHNKCINVVSIVCTAHSWPLLLLFFFVSVLAVFELHDVLYIVH